MSHIIQVVRNHKVASLLVSPETPEQKKIEVFYTQRDTESFKKRRFIVQGEIKVFVNGEIKFCKNQLRSINGAIKWFDKFVNTDQGKEICCLIT